MGQAAVEQCIGRLLTDEASRTRFRADPDATLTAITRDGPQRLTSAERGVLRAMPADRWDELAESIDPRLQRLAPDSADGAHR
jgi:hypothetical protein